MGHKQKMKVDLKIKKAIKKKKESIKKGVNNVKN